MMHIDMTTTMVLTGNKKTRRILNADRQTEFRKRMIAAGMVQVSGWVQGHQASDVIQLMRRLKTSGDLTVGPVRNVVSGKLEKLDK